MARKPTGRPNGRPPKKLTELPVDPLKKKVMADGLRLLNDEHRRQTPEDLAIMKANGVAQPVVPPGTESWNDAQVPAHTLVPLKALVPLSEEQIKEASSKTRGIIGVAVAGLQDRIPSLLDKIAERDPEKAVKLYIELSEFLTPKLQRVEQSGTVNHQHQHFVAVEPREEDPRRITAQVIDAVEVREVDSDGNEARLFDGAVEGPTGSSD